MPDAPDPSSAPLIVERQGDVLLLRLNRPERLNAVSPPMYAALNETLIAAAEDRSIRSLVVTGTGRAFCVGADLQAHGDAPLDADARRRYVLLAQEVNRRLQTIPQAVVAAVNGHAIGAGLELALSCDLIVVARRAKLRLPEAALGTFVGGGVTYTLARRVGEARAREFLLLCPFLDGEEAHRWGLANRVAAADEVEGVALDLAGQLALRAPLSVRRLKEVLRTAADDPDRALSLEADALLECMTTSDWAEGVAAFHERREPHFRGE
jgi:enoyl-CoA hydratase